MAPPLVLGDGTVVSDVACPALPDAELSDLDSANGMSPDQSTEREIPAVIAATADVLDEFLKRATTLLGSSSKGASNALFLQLIMDLTDIVPRIIPMHSFDMDKMANA